MKVITTLSENCLQSAEKYIVLKLSRKRQDLRMEFLGIEFYVGGGLQYDYNINDVIGKISFRWQGGIVGEVY